MFSTFPYDLRRLEECARNWKLTRIELFGSWARGDSRPDSDADLLVTFAPESRWSLFDLVELNDQLESILGRPVHLVEEGCVTNPFLLKSIRTDRRVLYVA